MLQNLSSTKPAHLQFGGSALLRCGQGMSVRTQHTGCTTIMLYIRMLTFHCFHGFVFRAIGKIESTIRSHAALHCASQPQNKGHVVRYDGQRLALVQISTKTQDPRTRNSTITSNFIKGCNVQAQLFNCTPARRCRKAYSHTKDSCRLRESTFSNKPSRKQQQ